LANECGIELIELRRKLALSRLDELLKPGEVSDLSDSVLESKLQHAAAEYNLGVGELLDATPRSSAIDPCAVETFALNSRRDRVPHSPRCRICRWLRAQSYKIDFKPDILGGIFLPREPSYACDHCIRVYLANRQVQQIERLTESEIPKSPNLRTWTGAFSPIAMVMLSGLYVFRSGVMQMAQLLDHGMS